MDLDQAAGAATAYLDRAFYSSRTVLGATLWRDRARDINTNAYYIFPPSSSFGINFFL